MEVLEDYLFAQGLEVMLPGIRRRSDADAAALHQDNLLTCNAVLVYYGAAPRAWVDIKLRELLKATGYGRETPIGLQAVYIAPLDDRRKERFQSHQAGVIRQPGEFRALCGTGHVHQSDQGGVCMSAAPATMNPFPGLRPFTQEEDYLFFWPRRTDDRVVTAAGQQPLRGGRGNLGQRQVVAGPLRIVIRATGWQDARGGRLVGDRRHASRRQPAGASDRRAPGGRPLRPRRRTRPAKTCSPP